ncbi:hypothetical protein ACOMHN_010733 [Nucella lapillus]
MNGDQKLKCVLPLPVSLSEPWSGTAAGSCPVSTTDSGPVSCNKMSTLRKMPHGCSDGLSGVRYTPASAEEDPEDILSDTGKLTYVTSRGGTVPLNGDCDGPLSTSAVTTATTTATTLSSPPIRDTACVANYPYYDFQDTDNESEGGGCDSAEPSSPSRLPNGKPLLCDYPSNYPLPHHNPHAPLSEKISVDSTGRHLPGTEFEDSRDLRELSKSPLSRTSRAGGKGRFMCCMMCIFFLSTAGLGVVLALACAGKVQLGPHPEHPSHISHSNGGFQTDRLGEDKVLVQVSESLSVGGTVEDSCVVLFFR